MVRIWKKEIVLDTDEGEVRLSFSPAQPRGYTELTRAIASFSSMRDEAMGLSKGSPEAAGAFIIEGEMRSLIALKEAIRAALLPEEWGKVEGFIDFIDIRGMLEIASAILNAYMDYYGHRLSDGLEA